ncbi:hypothetical protein P9D31_14355 [Bacillus haynesii]|nr:hypothetical protein [Bacillus haynesii]MEC1473515.1 hypothetical protein [Bacillus haynesii]MEC1559767.1 hypothetical protein [Bacillus haynesii]
MKKFAYLAAACLLTAAVLRLERTQKYVQLKKLDTKKFFQGYDGAVILKNAKSGETFVIIEE